MSKSTDRKTMVAIRQAGAKQCIPTHRTRERDVTHGIEGGGERENVSVTKEVSQRAGFYKVGCNLISIPR